MATEGRKCLKAKKRLHQPSLGQPMDKVQWSSPFLLSKESYSKLVLTTCTLSLGEALLWLLGHQRGKRKTQVQPLNWPCVPSFGEHGPSNCPLGSSKWPAMRSLIGTDHITSSASITINQSTQENQAVHWSPANCTIRSLQVGRIIITVNKLL